MTTVINGNQALRGNLDLSAGTLTLKDDALGKSKILQEALAPFAVPLTALLVWDDLNARLPGAAAADDLGIIEGTYGTDAPTVQSGDGKATTITRRARVLVPIPRQWVVGADLRVRIRAGMVTTVSDTTATVDLECYVNDGDGAVGSDLCTTAAQSCNNLSKADLDFTIDGAALVAGDVLDLRITIAITDGATGTAVIGEISALKVLADARG